MISNFKYFIVDYLNKIYIDNILLNLLTRHMIINPLQATRLYIDASELIIRVYR